MSTEIAIKIIPYMTTGYTLFSSPCVDEFWYVKTSSIKFGLSGLKHDELKELIRVLIPSLYACYFRK